MALNLPDANKVVGDGNHTSDTNLIIEAINTLKSEVDGIPAGATGAKGDPGNDGAPGQAATITIGSTTTGAAGTSAAVTNDGDEQNAVLNFTIPQGVKGDTGATGATGAQGPKGDPGDNAAISIGTTTTGPEGSSATVTNSGTTTNAVLNFTIPRGDTGPAANLGTTAALDLGTAAAGTSALASREDHVHDMPSASDVGADPAGTASSAVSTHNAATTSVHGIADTSVLATTSYVDTAEADAVTTANAYSDSLASNYDPAGTASTAVSTHNADTTLVHGIADTSALVVTTDSRLSDERTPLDNSVTSAKIANGAIVDADVNAAAGIAPTKISGTAVVDSDSRLSDARTPTSHAASHASGGSDPVTLAQSQVTNLTTDLGNKADASALTTHTSATTSVHGITDTSALVVDGDPNLVNFVTSATRPSPATEGQIIYETDTDSYYGYNGSDWVSVGGGATGGGTNQVFYENETNVTDSYTITTGYNAMSAGPITVDSGATVTIPSGSVWTVV